MNISTNRLFILGAENADAHAWPIADRPPPSFRGPWIARSNGMKMTTRPVEIDYLIAGADAVSMALADALVRKPGPASPLLINAINRTTPPRSCTYMVVQYNGLESRELGNGCDR